MRSSPRSVISCADWSSTSWVYSRNTLVLPGAGGVLQLEYGLRAEQVGLAIPPPLVLAAGLQPPVRLPPPRAG